MKYNITIKDFLFIGLLFLANVVHAYSWAPVNQEELKMDGEPKDPTAAAVILEKREERDDSTYKVSIYKRIKVYSRDGLRFGNVFIPYEKGVESIENIRARTVRPDGQITEFDGKVIDSLTNRLGSRYWAKQFDIPGLEIGGIVEYSYVKVTQPCICGSSWILAEELFTKHAIYTFKPHNWFGFRTNWPHGVPAGAKAITQKGEYYYLETSDVPGLETEDHMPPPEELQYRVDFIYDLNGMRRFADTDSATYWKNFGDKRSKETEEFIGTSKDIEKTAAIVISGSVVEEEKLRKIYDHVQGLLNIEFEPKKAEEIQKREKRSVGEVIKNVITVEKYGYGNSWDLNCLFVALARAAGLKANVAYISSRRTHFFQTDAKNDNELMAYVAIVTLNGKELFFQPGNPYIPFGMLLWPETGVRGLRLDETSASWIKTPMTESQQSKVMRQSLFRLQNGSLIGTVTVTYTGLDALNRRLEERSDDSSAKKQYAEDELRRSIPAKIEASLKNEPDWNGVNTPLVFEYNVSVLNWATSADKKVAMKAGLFGASEKGVFEKATRANPIYFRYPNIVEDDISIELPEYLNVDTLVKPRNENIQVIAFSSSAEKKGNFLLVHRNLVTNNIYVPEKYYPAVRDLFMVVRSSDEAEIELSSSK